MLSLCWMSCGERTTKNKDPVVLLEMNVSVSMFDTVGGLVCALF